MACGWASFPAQGAGEERKDGRVEGWEVTAQCGFPAAISSFAFQWGLSITPHTDHRTAGRRGERAGPLAFASILVAYCGWVVGSEAKKQWVSH